MFTEIFCKGSLLEGCFNQKTGTHLSRLSACRRNLSHVLLNLFSYDSGLFGTKSRNSNISKSIGCWIATKSLHIFIGIALLFQAKRYVVLRLVNGSSLNNQYIPENTGQRLNRSVCQNALPRSTYFRPCLISSFLVLDSTYFVGNCLQI